MTTIHLIDASPYLFRAFFSLPRTMVDGRGRPNNAVYGFTKFMEKYIADHEPTHIAVAFDRHFNQSFRNQFYPPYKAHREKSPPELDAQVDPSVAAMASMGVATFIDETHEADDLIATIIAQTRDDGAQYVIVTSDKDLTQLVSERVTWFDAGRKIRLDVEGVKAKFGVRPDQITDFLGLAGDSVDNIPGVRGIGPKTAAELLRKYGSIEALCADRPSMRETQAELSKRLATVSVEAPIRVKMEALRFRGAAGS